MDISKLVIGAALTTAIGVPSGATATGGTAADRIIENHVAAIAACDPIALADDYTEDATLFLPDGVVFSGRAELLELFTQVLKPPAEGGLCGMQIESVDRFWHGTTLLVTFEVSAPFLTQPYLETDAYSLKGGHIAAEVTTFDVSKLPFAQ